MAQTIYFFPLDVEIGADWDRRVILDVINKGALEPVSDERCCYPDGSGGEMNVDGNAATRDRPECLSFWRFGGRTMMERLFELADSVEAWLTWTDYVSPEVVSCVTRQGFLDRLAIDIRQDFNAIVARDASHLNQLVKGETFHERGW